MHKQWLTGTGGPQNEPFARAEDRRMNKLLRALEAILSTAWYAALTLFCVAVFGTALFDFADKFLNNDIVACVVLCFLLILLTGTVGNYVKKKANGAPKDYT